MPHAVLKLDKTLAAPGVAPTPVNHYSDARGTNGRPLPVPGLTPEPLEVLRQPQTPVPDSHPVEQISEIIVVGRTGHESGERINVPREVLDRA